VSKHQIGIHVLTAYPPSNPNRDENGQPKTAIVNGVTRQRISSQCIKRAWRLSDLMKDFVRSTRTRGLGTEVEKSLIAGGTDAKVAKKRATAIAEVFGSVSKKKPPEHSEMVIIGQEEWDAALALAAVLTRENRDATEAELASLQRDTGAVDVSLFGRMRAAATKFNVDASVYVSHPLTTGKATIDADFWTSVDDLKQADEDADGGSGGMGDVEFGSGTYYTYVQVNQAALIDNLTAGDASALPQATELSRQVILKLIEAIANVSPNGHKTTFGNEVRASYLRVEVGQPSGNLFCKAFEEPISGTAKAVQALQVVAGAEAQAFSLHQKVFEFTTAQTLTSVLSCVAKELESA